MAARESALGALQKRRKRECRLTRDHALKTLDEAGDFLTDRGLLTRMPDSALPSLFGACHEAPSKPGGRGFDLWPRTRWMWSFQLTLRPGTLLTKLHRGKSLYLSADFARLLDPLVRQSIADARGDEATFLGHLEEHGDSTLDDMELELGWDRKRLKGVRDRLQRVGAVVGDGLVFEDESTFHFAPVRGWDKVVLQPAPASRGRTSSWPRFGRLCWCPRPTFATGSAGRFPTASWTTLSPRGRSPDPRPDGSRASMTRPSPILSAQ